MMRTTFALAGLIALAAGARADIFHNYENLSEGFLGTTYSADGVTYREVNNVSGFYADGQPFSAGEPGDQLIIEDATVFYPNFPTFGSSTNVLTFGSAFINGPNLSIGALASVFMDISQPASSASFDIAFYENGPWGGIVYHLDALNGTQVVGSDTFTIANGGGRDNATFRTMSVTASSFNTLHLYATLNGNYTAPRGMIDNLRITSAVPEPATLAALGLPLLAMMRRRRASRRA